MELTKPELIAIITALVGTVVVLWKINKFLYDKEINGLKAWAERETTSLEECRKMHVDTNVELRRLSQECGYLNGRIDGISEMSDAVMKRLDKVVGER